MSIRVFRDNGALDPQVRRGEAQLILAIRERDCIVVPVIGVTCGVLWKIGRHLLNGPKLAFLGPISLGWVWRAGGSPSFLGFIASKGKMGAVRSGPR